MGKRRPERDVVEKLILDNVGSKAHEIARESGLIDSLGYDKSVDYIKQVRKSMRIKGTLPTDTSKYATAEERLKDITTLFNLRRGKMSVRAAWYMLFLNCYCRLRSEDDDIHMGAINDTYMKNDALENPLPGNEAIEVCNRALAWYMQSIDEEKNRTAKAKGYPGAGLNYTDDSLIDKCEITDTELKFMQSIRRNVE